MLEQLVEKYTLSQSYFSTSPGNILNFRSYREGNKFFYESPEKIQCYDLDDGRTHSIDRDWNPNDWRLFRLLYVKGFQENLFRIDVPLEQQTFDMHGHLWQYTKVMRPGLANGAHNATVWNETLEQNVTEYYETMIDHVYNLLFAAVDIADLENNGLIPLFSGKRTRDDEGYYFVKTFDGWNSSLQTVINTLVNRYNNPANNHLCTPEYLADWEQRARTKWEALL